MDDVRPCLYQTHENSETIPKSRKKKTSKFKKRDFARIQ